jgi:hypothetical protein
MLVIIVAASTIVSSNVRSTDPVIGAALSDGIQRSEVIRRLVEAIDASDLIVYLARGECPRPAVACLMMAGRGAGVRYARINIQLPIGLGKKGGWHRDELSVMIAHELQHAAEVAEWSVVRCRGQRDSAGRVRPQRSQRRVFAVGHRCGARSWGRSACRIAAAAPPLAPPRGSLPRNLTSHFVERRFAPRSSVTIAQISRAESRTPGGPSAASCINPTRQAPDGSADYATVELESRSEEGTGDIASAAGHVGFVGRAW